ncbi:MAG: molybdenum cofactor guanylyltransferase [Deltaproteobacteria bacterium]|nr:molybdenum cofactor guanylyltransferase [Deltaproteobacteria bacterium]
MLGSETTALILAGGRATRFGGIAKHELVVDGERIFDRQVSVLAPRVSRIIVSSQHAIAGYTTVADAVPDGGPLAGIAAGLAAVTTPWLLVVAGDMPYLTGAVIDLVLGRIQACDDGVGIEIDGLPQPLICALRCEAARPALARMLETDQRKASRLLTDAGLTIRWLAEPDLRAVDPTLRSLGNVNAPGDLMGVPGR